MQAAGGQHLVVQELPFRLQRRHGAFLLGGGEAFVVADGGDLLVDVAAQHDVGAATGHVGGDGDHAGPAGLGDDLRLACACCLAFST